MASFNKSTPFTKTWADLIDSEIHKTKQRYEYLEALKKDMVFKRMFLYSCHFAIKKLLKICLYLIDL